VRTLRVQACSTSKDLYELFALQGKVLQRRGRHVRKTAAPISGELSTTSPITRHPRHKITLADANASSRPVVYKRMRGQRRPLIIYCNGPRALEALAYVARIGAVQLVVSRLLAANELPCGSTTCHPKASFAASCGVGNLRAVVGLKPLLDEAINRPRHKPDFCLILGSRDKPLRSERARDKKKTLGGGNLGGPRTRKKARPRP